MTKQTIPTSDNLPLVPDDVLQSHDVHEKYGTRFRSCARLLQAIWREEQGLPIGTLVGKNDDKRKMGSLIDGKTAAKGRNFMTPGIADMTRREVAYQESGALIEQGRLYGNLLSSMPLTFNMFAPLKFDMKLAAQVVRSLVPDIDLKTVTKVLFEHSPGRRNDNLTGDRTAFDVAIIYERGDGKTGFVGIEIKYSESMFEAAPSELNPRYETLAPSSGLFKDPMSAVLRTNPIQQLFRQHLLAYAALERSDWAEARFITIGPRHNLPVQHASKLYAAHLDNKGDIKVPFQSIELEQFIEALGWAGEQDYAAALHDRYTDWTKLDPLVETSLAASSGGKWKIKPPQAKEPFKLVAKAA